MTELFIVLCRNGNLDKLKKFIKKYMWKINIHKDNEYGCIIPCNDISNGYYNLINIHTNRESGFRVACMNNYKHIVKYLLSNGCYSLYYNDILFL